MRVVSSVELDPERFASLIAKPQSASIAMTISCARSLLFSDAPCFEAVAFLLRVEKLTSPMKGLRGSSISTGVRLTGGEAERTFESK